MRQFIQSALLKMHARKFRVGRTWTSKPSTLAEEHNGMGAAHTNDAGADASRAAAIDAQQAPRSVAANGPVVIERRMDSDFTNECLVDELTEDSTMMRRSSDIDCSWSLRREPQNERATTHNGGNSSLDDGTSRQQQPLVFRLDIAAPATPMEVGANDFSAPTLEVASARHTWTSPYDATELRSSARLEQWQTSPPQTTRAIAAIDDGQQCGAVVMRTHKKRHARGSTARHTLGVDVTWLKVRRVLWIKR